MNIALLADDGKKELMVQFCIAYCGILSEHKICATATTGKLVSENTRPAGGRSICTTSRGPSRSARG